MLISLDGKSKVYNDTSVHAIALKIMKEHSKPMTIKEIANLVLQQKKISSKFPYQTISSVLQRSQYIKRVGKATYQLKEN